MGRARLQNKPLTAILFHVNSILTFFPCLSFKALINLNIYTDLKNVCISALFAACVQPGRTAGSYKCSFERAGDRGLAPECLQGYFIIR